MLIDVFKKEQAALREVDILGVDTLGVDILRLTRKRVRWHKSKSLSSLNASTPFVCTKVMTTQVLPTVMTFFWEGGGGLPEVIKLIRKSQQHTKKSEPLLNFEIGQSAHRRDCFK